MNYNQTDFTKSCGTHLQGIVDIDFARLEEIFGEAYRIEDDGGKVDAEWCIEFDDGTVATIYNYKDGVNYLGDSEGLAVEDITEWHIGGRSPRSLELILDAISEA